MPQLANPIQLQKYLKGMEYPAKKKSLLDRARDEGADENVLYTLERLPDKEYRWADRGNEGGKQAEEAGLTGR